MYTIQACPIFPVIFDGMIQTISIIRAKDISKAFGVNRLLVLIHGIPLKFTSRTFISEQKNEIFLNIKLK
jgi:hypothetical protein